MDWIEVTTDQIDKSKLSRGNTNEASAKMIAFLSCLDVMWEGVQQLHRVFLNTSEAPFADNDEVFRHKHRTTTDNLYFKTIRACFSAHPVNLNDFFAYETEKERRYAGWSGGGFGKEDFSVFLYSNEPNKPDFPIGIYFDELIAFAEQRFEYIEILIDEINRQKEAYVDQWRNIPIEKRNNPLEQIHILISENKKRLNNDYYNYELMRLKLLFESSVTSASNQEIVCAFRKCLLPVVDALYSGVQSMSFDELPSYAQINVQCPDEIRYYYGKLCDTVFGGGSYGHYSVDAFADYFLGVVDLTIVSDEVELYTLVEAAIYFKDQHENHVRLTNDHLH